MHALTLSDSGWRDALKAATLVKDAAKTAAKACEKAGVRRNACDIAARTAEEAAALIGKRDGDDAQLAIRHCQVISRGLALMREGVDKKSDQMWTDFFVETLEAKRRSSEIADLLTAIEEHARSYDDFPGFDWKARQAGEKEDELPPPTDPPSHSDDDGPDDDGADDDDTDSDEADL